MLRRARTSLKRRIIQGYSPEADEERTGVVDSLSVKNPAKELPMGNSGALVDLTNASSDEGEEILSDSEYDFDDDDEDYNYEGFDDMMAEATTSSADADQASPVCFHETLRGDDVYKEMMNAVQEMAVVVNLPQDDVLRLLSRYDWDTARFQVCLVSWYHPFAAV